jgi:hypothetical protein
MNTVAEINRALERASHQSQREFLFFLMGWLETAEKQRQIHPNTLTGVEYAAKSSIRRHATEAKV